MLNETYAITVNHNVRRTVEVMLNESYAITVNQCRTSWSTLRLFLYATPVRVNLRFEIEITLLGMTVKAVLSVQACPSKLCSEGFKIIINSLMAFKEGAVLECMRYWGGVFPPRRGRNGSCVVGKSTLKGRGWSTTRRRSSWVELEGRSTTACACRVVLLGVDVTATSESLEGILRSVGFTRAK